MIDLSRVSEPYLSELQRTIAGCSFDLNGRLSSWIEVVDIPTTYFKAEGEPYYAGELTWEDGHMAIDDVPFDYRDWLGHTIRKPWKPVRPLYRRTNTSAAAKKAWRKYDRKMRAYRLEMAVREARRGELFRAFFSHGTWHLADYQIVEKTPGMGQAIADIWGVSTWEDPYRHQTAALWQKAFFDHAQDAPFSDTQVARFKELFA